MSAYGVDLGVNSFGRGLCNGLFGPRRFRFGFAIVPWKVFTF